MSFLARPGMESGHERATRQGRHAARLARSGRVSAATALWIAGLRGRNDRAMFNEPLRTFARRRPSRPLPRIAPRHRSPVRCAAGRQRRASTSRDDGGSDPAGDPPPPRSRRSRPRTTGGELRPARDLILRIFDRLLADRSRRAAMWRRRARRSGGIRPRLSAKSGLPGVTS